jgi:hypothetical protein
MLVLVLVSAAGMLLLLPLVRDARMLGRRMPVSLCGGDRGGGWHELSPKREKRPLVEVAGARAGHVHDGTHGLWVD